MSEGDRSGAPCTAFYRELDFGRFAHTQFEEEDEEMEDGEGLSHSGYGSVAHRPASRPMAPSAALRNLWNE